MERPFAARSRIARRFALGALAVAALSHPGHAQADNVTAAVYVDGLDFPVSMAVSNDGTILVTQKSGTLRVIRGGVLDPDPVATFGAYQQNEAGLGGITLAPDFEQSRLVIVSYVPAADRDHIYLSRVRLLDQGGEIVDDPWLALPSVATTDRHYSGIPRFGPDGRLYVALGDLAIASRAQNPAALSGSLLRYEADLSIPADNPFGPDAPAFAYGFRNPFGLDVGPDGVIHIADNGGFRQDELHRVQVAGNHGNPVVTGYCDGNPSTEPCADAGSFVDPVHEFPETTGPTSVVAYHANLIPGLNGDVLVGGWHSRQVHRFRENPDSPGRYDVLPSLFVLEGGSFTPVADEWWPDKGVTDVKVAPDGAVLVLVAGFTQGTLYRITPAISAPPGALEAGTDAGAAPPGPVGSEPLPVDASMPDDGSVASTDGGASDRPDVSVEPAMDPSQPPGEAPQVTLSGGCTVSRRSAPESYSLAALAASFALLRRRRRTFNCPTPHRF